MATLAEVNEAAPGHTQFRIQSFDGHRPVVVGGFDLCYYHYIELHFVDVTHINCPVWFDHPQFSDEGSVGDAGSGSKGPRRFAIRTDEGRHEITAAGVEAVLGMVYHYDHGADLKPGERIATWVKRTDAEPGAGPDLPRG